VNLCATSIGSARVHQPRLSASLSAFVANRIKLRKQSKENKTATKTEKLP
jgi:hypothetical protein